MKQISDEQIKQVIHASESKLVWYGNNGTSYIIPEMETSHLFYCIRMVWNCTMPPHMTYGIRRPTNWILNPHMLPYYKDVLPSLFTELAKRNDLTDAASIAELKLMRTRALQHINEVPQLTLSAIAIVVS